MPTALRRLLHLAKVSQSADEVKIQGLPADTIAEDIIRTWGTAKIATWIFSKIKRNEFSFLNFFAPDIHYTLSAIIHTKGTRSSRHAIQGVLRGMEEESWLKNITLPHASILNYDKLKEMNVSLLPHQMDFLRIYDQRLPRFMLNGYLLSAAAGTGKTIACLALSLCLDSDIVFIVSPKNAVRRVWESTLKTRLKKKPTIWIAEENRPYKNEKYVIVHYEALNKALVIARSRNASRPIVLLDESHNLNEYTAQRTHLFIDLCKALSCKHVIWSSGTPLKAMGYEMIPILRTIDPMFTPQAEERFRKVFGMATGRAVDILRNRIGLVAFKVTKGDIVDNKATTKRIEIKLSDGEQFTLDHIRKEMELFVAQRTSFYKSKMRDYEKSYEECLKLHERTLTTSEEKSDFKRYNTYIKMIRTQYVPERMKVEAQYCNTYELKRIIPSLPDKEHKDAFKDTRSVIKYVYLKVFGEALGTVLGKKRAQCHVEMLPHMDWDDIIKSSEKKVVVFTSFVAVVKSADEYLKSKGYKPLLVYGDTNSNVDGIISKFEKDLDANPLIATYQSLSTAVPLVMANTAVFINQPFRDHEMVQARARIDRLGQDTSVRFYNVFLDTGDKSNISTRAADILNWSKQMVDSMMGEDAAGKANAKLDQYFNQPSMEEYAPRFDSSFDDQFDIMLKDWSQPQSD